MNKEQKDQDLGADAAAVVTAGPVASDQLPHAEQCDEIACRDAGCWQCDPESHKFIGYVESRLSTLRCDLQWYLVSVHHRTRDPQILLGSSLRAEQIETEIKMLVDLRSFLESVIGTADQPLSEASPTVPSEAQK